MTHRTELLIIGNEILSGRTIDTHSHWLSQRLFTLGLPVIQIQVVEDNTAGIAQAIQDSCKRQTTLLITSGGLGPTFDDLTTKGLAAAIKTPLRLHPKALQMVTHRYAKLKEQGIIESETLTPPRRKMAILPEGAEPLPNQVGTAPGLRVQLESMTIYCLPGVPEELHAMFLQEVVPRTAHLSEKVYLQEVTQLDIYEEAKLAPILTQVMDRFPDTYLKSLPQLHIERKPLRVAIIVSVGTDTEARKILRQVVDALHEAIQP
jgi:molybdenum cofactor synthesis domain-containing protein